MKFKMRYADQIVGVLVVLAIISLIFVIFMIGKTQRWFSKKYTFKTYTTTAAGLSQNLAITFKGIPIGNVKSFQLTEDNQVEVFFTIQEEFRDRVRVGSLTEVVVSPIGLGAAQFILYTGRGEPLEEGVVVPLRDSIEGKLYISRGLADIPPKDDFITLLMEQASEILQKVQFTLDGINVGPDEKSAVTSIGQSITNLQNITGRISEGLNQPDGVMGIVSGEGDTIRALESALFSLSGLLDNLERTTARLPNEMPQIYSLIAESRNAVKAAENVLISLQNNPLLRKGIPERAEMDTSGTNPRDIRF